MITLQRPKETKAKNIHRCNFCGEQIRIGETYIKSVHIYDDVYSWKSHKHCDKLCKDLKMYDHCDDGVTQDDFSESVREYHHQLMVALLPKDNPGNSDILKQLRDVNFKDQMWYVIRHLNKQQDLTALNKQP